MENMKLEGSNDSESERRCISLTHCFWSFVTVLDLGSFFFGCLTVGLYIYILVHTWFIFIFIYSIYHTRLFSFHLLPVIYIYTYS